MKEMTLNVYENGGSERQCESGGDWTPMKENGFSERLSWRSGFESLS